MKKHLLAGVGVVGACVACCAVPLALPIISGLSAGSIAGALGRDHLSGSAPWVLALGAAALASGLALWLGQRAKAPVPSCAIPMGQKGGGCDCAPHGGKAVRPG